MGMLKAFSAMIALLIFTSSANASVIDYQYNGSRVCCWGPAISATQSFGEIFTAPEPKLKSYSLFVQLATGVSPNSQFPFVSQIYSWNGVTTVGSAVFTSETLTTPVNMTKFDFAPDISLNQGEKYIALVTAVGGGGWASLGLAQAPPFNFAIGPSVIVEGARWSCVDQPCGRFNLAFHAEFADVEEPRSLVVVGSSLLLMLWLSLMRVRRIVGFGSTFSGSLLSVSLLYGPHTPPAR